VYPHVKSFIVEHNKGEGKSVATKPKAVAKKSAPLAKKAVAKSAAKKATPAKK
jgi:hypothetical protein